jgi:RNA polymerase subunit RPABC4/transcription elongation factor Spt4
MTIIMIAIFVVVVLALLGIGRSGRLQTRDARGIFSRKCPNCRMLISDRARICRHCHEPTGFKCGPKPISAMDMSCPHCEAIFNRWKKFCPECGRSPTHVEPKVRRVGQNEYDVH